MEEQKLEMFSVSFFGGLGGLNFLELVVNGQLELCPNSGFMNFQGFAVCHTSLCFFVVFLHQLPGAENDGKQHVFLMFKEDIQSHTLVSV